MAMSDDGDDRDGVVTALFLQMTRRIHWFIIIQQKLAMRSWTTK
jgi:hypothetical protein